MRSSEHRQIFLQLQKVCEFSNRNRNKQVFLFDRRDRLWIAMELCEAGSVQDIYQGFL